MAGINRKEKNAPPGRAAKKAFNKTNFYKVLLGK